MAGKVTNYEEFIIVAETEWKFDYDFETNSSKIPVLCAHGSSSCSFCQHPFQCSLNPRIIKQSLKMGLVEWNIAFNDQAQTLEFTCQSIEADGAIKEVHMELVRYCRSDSGKNYEKKETKRHVFTRSANSLSISELHLSDNLFTIRLLKDRPLFPDFTSESTVVGGRWASDVKLRVVEQVFHVNKQLLAMHSEYFDLMFNGAYKEANQEEVKLKHEQADAAMFHDFLLVMFVPEALPNPKNLAALTKLANIYDANAVRDNCYNHLTMCREMPVEERFMLAGEIGNEELQNSIRQMASLEEANRISSLEEGICSYQVAST